MADTNQTGVKAVFDTRDFEAGEKRYIAILDNINSKTQTTSIEILDNISSKTQTMSIEFEHLNPSVTELGESLSKTKTKAEHAAGGLGKMSVSANDARVAVYGAADAIELLGGPNITPALNNITGLGQGLAALGLSAGGAVGVGAISAVVGGAIGIGIVEGMKRGGIISPDTQGADVTAKQLGAMAASAGQYALTFATTLGDTAQATDEANKAFVNAAVSLGVMTDETKKLIAENQGWGDAAKKQSVTYRDLTGDAERYAKAKAKEREEEEKKNAITKKYSEKEIEIAQSSYKEDLEKEREYYASRETAMQKYNLSVQRAEDAHQRSMAQKQQAYALSMDDALGSRDAIAASRIRRQYALDKANSEAEHGAKMSEQSVDAANELAALEAKYLESQAIRDAGNQTEIDKLAASKAEELSVFQASLDAEKTAREQYAKDLAMFWEQHDKMFPMAQQFPNYKVASATVPFKTPPTSNYQGMPFSAAQTVTGPNFESAISADTTVQMATWLTNEIHNMWKNLLTGAGTEGAKLGAQYAPEIRAIFDASVLGVLYNVFNDASRP